MLMVPVLTAPLWLSAAADASCAEPQIDIGRRFEVAPGDELVVTGRFWSDTCDDTGGSSMCSQDELDPSRPTQDIRLMLIPKGEGDRVFLAEVDADPNSAFRVEVVVPEVPPGRYVIREAGGMGDFGPGSIRVKAR